MALAGQASAPFSGNHDSSGCSRQAASRWATNLPFFEGADFLMIQKPMSGAEFHDVKEGNAVGQDVTALLRDRELLRQMGRTLVGDVLTGNADRFKEMQMHNAFLTAAHRVGAIDTEAILQSFQGYGVKVAKPQHTPRKWAEMLVLEGGVKIMGEREGAPSSRLTVLDGTFTKWFYDFFVDYMTRDDNNARLIADAMVAPENPLPNWVQIKATIREGVDQALQDANASFNGPQDQFEVAGGRGRCRKR